MSRVPFMQRQFQCPGSDKRRYKKKGENKYKVEKVNGKNIKKTSPRLLCPKSLISADDQFTGGMIL